MIRVNDLNQMVKLKRFHNRTFFFIFNIFIIMKVLINESQYNFLIEQRSDAAMDQQGNALANAVGVRSNKDYNTVQRISKKSTEVASTPEQIHNVMTVLQIGTAFIPVVGPFISAGIGLFDASKYYQEGDKKTAGLMTMFALLPGAGSLVNKIPGIKQLGSQGLSLLASKLGKGVTKLTPLEQQVIAGLKVNQELVKTEINNQVKQLAQKSLTSKVKETTKKSLTKIAKTGLNVGKSVAPYVAADVVYNKVYDKLNPQTQLMDFTKIDLSNIKQVNKDAALSVKF